MNNFLSLLTLFLSCYLLIRVLKPTRITDLILNTFLVACTLIIMWGYLLASMNQLNNLSAWRNIGILTVLVLLFFVSIKKEAIFGLLPITWKSISREFSTLFIGRSLYEKFLIVITGATTVIIYIGLLVIISNIPPHDWDSMTYHLPRMAHYFQTGNLNYFDTNYWAQVVHPKNSTLLLLYSFITLARNENLTQIPQLMSYGIISISVYGVARKIGMDFAQGLFSAFISSLLISGINFANSAQNDLLLSAFLTASVYFFFSFRETQRKSYLFLAALGISLAAGTKATFLLAMPSTALLVLFLTYSGRDIKKWSAKLIQAVMYIFICMSLLTLPSGYIQNYREYGNLFGNQDVNTLHTFGDANITAILQGGFLNFLRYGVDFLSLDGLPPTPIVLHAQKALHYFPQVIFPLFDIHLDSREATSFSWFEFGIPPRGSYWGILGIGLIWIIVLLSLLRIIKRTDFNLLATAAFIFWCTISWSGPYDASKGRFFLMSIIFCVPLVGVLLNSKHYVLQVYVSFIIIAGCISAISALTLKALPISSTYPEFIEKKTIYEMDRLEQLTFNYQKYYRPFVAFEHTVPANASVAVFLYPNTFEYPLYGKFITRKIIPINSFNRGIQPIPPEAEYLLYSRGYPCPMPGDRQLGGNSGIFLRKLNKNNRECEIVPNP